jgi:putative endonuclease
VTGFFTKNFGSSAESIAEDILKEKGYRIIGKNFRSRFGEIDIIARDGGTTVFVEVKARRSLNYGYPEEAVTMRKLEKIRKTIDYYLVLNPQYNGQQRVEVLALLFEEGKVAGQKLICV